MSESYPLSWPPGWKRTPPQQRIRGMFGRGSSSQANYTGKRELTIGEGAARVMSELQRMGIAIGDVILSTNVQPSLATGLPLSKSANPADPGAAVYWRDGAHQRVMAIDRYDRVADNLAAIAATVEAMRAIERHGGAVILERAFTGFTALPAPITGQKPWREVFGFGADEKVSQLRLEAAYRTARSDAHPDRGGSDEQFVAVQAAYEQGMRELGHKP